MNLKDTTELKDSYRIAYNAYAPSRAEANEVVNMFHGRMYTNGQLNVLKDRGQPAENFNVIKLFTRQLIGYYSAIINTVEIQPKHFDSIDTATILNDSVQYVFDNNSFEVEGDKIKQDGLLSGLMCAYTDVLDTGKVDDFGRKIYDISIEHVPSSEIVLDPMSTRQDYKDANFIHRYKWLSEDEVKGKFGNEKVKELTEYYNFLATKESEFEYKYKEGQFSGIYNKHNNYLIVHSIVKDNRGNVWSVYWSDIKILQKTKINHKEVKNPYRVVKLSDSDVAEYYGIFRDVTESQKAINQALIQIQQMVNSSKAFVQEEAVTDLDEFTAVFNRVNAVIPVRDINGIKIENMGNDIIQQYNIIDKAFERIKAVLGITDAFLGVAFASDSGRKFKLQQESVNITLRYITNKLEMFYKMVGTDTANLIKQYYRATQVLRISDKDVGFRWLEINSPIVLLDNMGQPKIMTDEVIDPNTGEVENDKEGNPKLEPMNRADTDFQFTEFDVSVETASYNSESEDNIQFMNTFLNSLAGQAMLQTNPSEYYKIVELTVKSMKSQSSPEISKILKNVINQMSQIPQGMGV